jgi:predicted AlkP superfamily phosphohydrolase/phosphomutase
MNDRPAKETKGAGARSLVVGLDGADPDLVRGIGPRELPHLHGLMERGVHASLRSLQPPATLPNWLTFLTGVDPGLHGVFDFTVRDGYRVRFSGGCEREAPTVAARLDRMGLGCACLFFPGTWPPEPLANGIFISGWDSPVAFEADRSFVWPPGLHREIVSRFGPLRFDDVDEFAANRPGWHERLPGALVERIERKTLLAEWLLERRGWDLFAIYFGESDTASHHLWSFHDPASPRRPPRVTPALSRGLADVYRALDRALGRLLQAAGGERVEVTVLSDHGSGGSSDKVLYLNRFLQQAGLLRWRKNGPSRALSGRLRSAALEAVGPKTRERLFRAANRRLPSLLESRARFGAIDMKRTVMFSDELNYFPAVHFNLRGREAKGTLCKKNTDAARRDLEQALAGLSDPWTGRPVVKAVHAREELFRGPLLHRAPDLLLELELDTGAGGASSGYSYHLGRSAQAPPGTGVWRRLNGDELLGRKGQALSGSHRPRGLLLAAGPRVEPAGRLQAGIADATALLLARMGIDPPPEFCGKVPDGVLRGLPSDGVASPRPLAAGRRASAGQSPDQARVRARLKALGYIE